MKTSSIVLLGAAVVVGVIVLQASRKKGASKSASAAAASVFGPQLSGVFISSREPNPASDGTLVDNALDLLFARGGYYGPDVVGM